MPDYKNYEKSAPLYDAYIPEADYAAAASRLRELIRRRRGGAESLLDVACGSARHLEHLQGDFRCEGLELQPDFLQIARQRCPDVTFHQGDMARFDLGRRFDVVTCLFAAIAYVGTVERLNDAIACMARHLNPGGLLVIEPWLFPENYWLNRLNAEFIDQESLKICRMFITRQEGNVSVYDIHYLVGRPEGIEHFVEREELALFTDAQYRSALAASGLQAEHDPDGGLFGDAHNIGLYTGVKAR